MGGDLKYIYGSTLPEESLRRRLCSAFVSIKILRQYPAGVRFNDPPQVLPRVQKIGAEIAYSVPPLESFRGLAYRVLFAGVVPDWFLSLHI